MHARGPAHHRFTPHTLPASAGKYLKREVLNLARFISVTKTRPLTWRIAHPYLVADRIEVGRLADCEPQDYILGQALSGWASSAWASAGVQLPKKGPPLSQAPIQIQVLLLAW